MAILLGAAVGTVVSLLSWYGNRTRNLLSVFPDLVTVLVLVALLGVAAWFSARRTKRSGSITAWRLGSTIGVSAGLVFGTAMVIVGMMQFERSSVALLAFGFLTAFGSALLFAVLMSWAVLRTFAGKQRAL